MKNAHVKDLRVIDLLVVKVNKTILFWHTLIKKMTLIKLITLNIIVSYFFCCCLS